LTHPKLIETMMLPSFYPHRPERIELVQTHISFIFIVDDLVYKVKKAVDFGFLDFTSLEKRRFYCHEEVRLNRRLAPETYLEVVEIYEDAEGALRLGKGGRVCEYAVKMKKLPADRMLKKLLKDGCADVSVMDAVAEKLAAFHDQADTGGYIDEIGGVETIRLNHQENFEQTEKYIGITIAEPLYRFIKRYIYDFMDRKIDLLKQRVKEHRIRDCHGDLHLEHICMENGIVIFDCIEFNERFRYEDVAAEVAFLAMDLDFNNYKKWADRFVRSYIQYSKDHDIRILLNFYKCYYAYVRGKVTGFRIEDRKIVDEEITETKVTANRYFELAYGYAAQLERPTLIIMMGLMGTGKSRLTKNIAPVLDADVIRTDVLRKEMSNLSPTDRCYEPFGKGIYNEEMSEATYAKAHELALKTLREGRTVILDASYRKRSDRLKAGETARAADADFIIVECVCPEDVIRKRLEVRTLDALEPSDGRWDLYEEQKKGFEPIEELSFTKYIVIDTSGLRETSADKVLNAIRFGVMG